MVECKNCGEKVGYNFSEKEFKRKLQKLSVQVDSISLTESEFFVRINEKEDFDWLVKQDVLNLIFHLAEELSIKKVQIERI